MNNKFFCSAIQINCIDKNYSNFFSFLVDKKFYSRLIIYFGTRELQEKPFILPNPKFKLF